MRRTYAHNSFIIGGLIGIWVTIKAGLFLGILTGLAVSIIGYFLIRALENAISDGVDKGVDAISNAIHDRKKEKDTTSEPEDLSNRYK